MLEDVLVPVAFFSSIVAVAKILADYRTRTKLIARGAEARETQALLSAVGGRASSLKWGLVAIGTGVGLAVVDFASLAGGPVAPGVVLLFAGASLVAHYLLAGRAASRWSARKSTDPDAAA